MIPILFVVLAFLIRARERQRPRPERDRWADERERDLYQRRYDASIWRNIGGRL